jgi:hypothetical protein
MTDAVRSVRSSAYLEQLNRSLAPFRSNEQVRMLYRDMNRAGVVVPTTEP